MRIIQYGLQLVKEESRNYKIDNDITNSSTTAFKIFKDLFDLDKQAEEVFAMLCLNVKNKIVGVFEISRGSLSESLVHPREVFKRVLLCNASGIIIAHNHPGGTKDPSREDISVTKRLKECADLLGIGLVDHIIIAGENKYYSFAENGLLPVE